MTGHSSNETVPFTTTMGTTSTLFSQAAYGVSEKNQKFILSELYPPQTEPQGERWYTNEFQRSVFLSSEWSFTCNTRWLGVAYGQCGSHESYAYRFEVDPGWHGQDISYTFWNGQGIQDGILPDVAKPMQRHLVEFARRGTPNAEGLPNWPTYQSGGGHTIMAFGIPGLSVKEDHLKNERCEYWQSGEYQDLL
jgi:carboxylesterase type B